MSRLALVTGGSRGIGKCTADLLRERGWDVLAPGREQCDWTEILDVGGLAESIRAKLDAVIFCHGVWFWSLDQSVYDWEQHYRMRVAMPAEFLRQKSDEIKGGVVVAVASTRGFIGGLENGPYAAACAAQIALMQGLAREFKAARFNAVCPGLTDTDLGKEVIRTGGAKPDAVPQPAEAVAAAIVSLIEGTDNGAVLRVVDGMTTRARWVWE